MRRMAFAFELFVSIRYVCARGQNIFVSFTSLISMLGVALGVMALIVVLSVMNGFEKEITERTLGMAAHATLHAKSGELENWPELVRHLEDSPHMVGAAPFYRAEGMLKHGGQIRGTVIQGILPEREAKVSEIGEKMVSGALGDLRSGDFGIILGTELAQRLGVAPGDKVNLFAAQANVTPIGVLPRTKRFTVTGVFDAGMREYDSALALVHMDDICLLFRCRHPSAIRIQTDDAMRAPLIARSLRTRISGIYHVSDWTQQHENLFHALKTERTVMFVILALIVAVAAFNIISTLVMAVTEKQADIAVLRTMGSSPYSILRVFVLQGVLIGLAGVFLGVCAGVTVSLNVETWVPWLERFFDIQFLPSDVYYISELPSDLQWEDVWTVSGLSFLLCTLATIYPSLRAAHTQPAQALRHE